MADIELVIKIPEEIHQDIMNHKQKDKFKTDGNISVIENLY